jgi:hypothetical protein
MWFDEKEGQCFLKTDVQTSNSEVRIATTSGRLVSDVREEENMDLLV